MSNGLKSCRLPLRVLLDDAIGLYIEYIERYGRSPEEARPQAVAEVIEGDRMRCADLEQLLCADCRRDANAPELLAACEAVLHQRSIGDASAGKLDDIAWCAQMLRVAIAKARRQNRP